jgi:hypothetical protein
MLVAYEAGPATDVAGVITHLAGAIGSGVGGPTAGTAVSRCTQMPVVDDVPLAPTDAVQESGDEPPELEVVTAGEDVSL